MANALLGSYMIDLDADGSKIDKEIARVLDSADRFAGGIDRTITEAFRHAQQNATGSLGRIFQEGGKSAQESASAFVNAHARAMARMERVTAEHARGSERTLSHLYKQAQKDAKDSAKVFEQALDAGSNVKISDRSTAANENALSHIFGNVSGKSASESAAAFLEGSVVSVLDEIDSMIDGVDQKVAGLAQITGQDLSDLAIASHHVETAVKAEGVAADRAAVIKKRLADATDRATKKLREQKIVLDNVKDATAEAGFRYTSLGDAINDGLRGLGPQGAAMATGLAKGGIIAFLAKEALQLGATIIQGVHKGISTADTDALWAEWWAKSKRSVARGKSGFWEWMVRESLVGRMAGVSGLDDGSQTFKQLSGAIDKNADEFLKRYRALGGTQYNLGRNTFRISGNRPSQQLYGADPMQERVEQFRERADRDNAIRQRTVQLALEHAQLTNNKGAIDQLNVSLDELLRTELMAAGMGAANTNIIVAQTQANRSLTRAISDLNEEMETIGMQQEVARADVNVTKQRELAEQYTETSLALATLTGKSHEHIQALIDQGRIAQDEITKEVLNRRLATVTLQQEVAQAFGNIEAQRTLASEYTNTTIALAHLEHRSKEYVAALVAQGKVAQARIEQERIGRDMSVAQAQQEVARLRNQIALTGAFVPQIAALVDQYNALSVARLRASVDPNDRKLANLMEDKFELEKIFQAQEGTREFLASYWDMAMQVAGIEAWLAGDVVATRTLREEEARTIERRAHDDRVRQIRELEAVGRRSAEEANAEILRSRELLDARMREIDARYGSSWRDLVTRLAADYAQQMMTVDDLARSGLRSLEDFIAAMRPSAIRNFGDIKAAGLDMLRSIESEIMRFLAQKAVKALLFGLLGGQSKSTAAFQIIDAFGMANGGVIHMASGGSVHRRDIAPGSVARTPTVVYGEGRYSEAYVPMLDGKTIPVTIKQLPTVATAGANAHGEPVGGRNMPARETRQVIEVPISIGLSDGFLGGIASRIRPAVQPTSKEILVPVTEDILNRGPLFQVIRHMVLT